MNVHEVASFIKSQYEQREKNGILKMSLPMERNGSIWPVLFLATNGVCGWSNILSKINASTKSN